MTENLNDPLLLETKIDEYFLNLELRNYKNSYVIIIVGLAITIVTSIFWTACTTLDPDTYAVNFFLVLFGISWSGQYYAQIYLNWRRKCTIGVSIDTAYFSFSGITCFLVFCGCTYHQIRFTDDRWFDDHGRSLAYVKQLLFLPLYHIHCTNKSFYLRPRIEITGGIVFVVTHAWICSVILIAQMYYYDGTTYRRHNGRNDLSRHTKFIIAVFILYNIAFLILVALKASVYKYKQVSLNQWLFSLLYWTSIFLGLKSISQVYKNRRFRIFEGLSMLSIVLEAVGSFSLFIYSICDGALVLQISFLDSIANHVLVCLLAALCIATDVILIAQSTKYPIVQTETDKFVKQLLGHHNASKSGLSGRDMDTGSPTGVGVSSVDFGDRPSYGRELTPTLLLNNYSQ